MSSQSENSGAPSRVAEDRWARGNEHHHDETRNSYEREVRPPNLPGFVFFYKQHLGFLDRLDRGVSVLDVGAGTGDFCADLLKKGFTDITALDVSSGMLELIREVYPTVKTCHGDIINLPFEDASFDFINVKGCLHHVYFVEQAVAELIRCLRPGGYLRLQEPQAGRKPEPVGEGELERPLSFPQVLRLLEYGGLRVETRRHFLHFETNRRLDRYIKSRPLKDAIVRVCNPVSNFFGFGDIFLLIARKP